MRAWKLLLERQLLRFIRAQFNKSTNAISSRCLVIQHRANLVYPATLITTRIGNLVDWLYFSLVYRRGQPL